MPLCALMCERRRNHTSQQMRASAQNRYRATGTTAGTHSLRDRWKRLFAAVHLHCTNEQGDSMAYEVFLI